MQVHINQWLSDCDPALTQLSMCVQMYVAANRLNPYFHLIVYLQAETDVSSLTKELQRIEDELDSAESRLGTITEQLKQAEAQADESERSGLSMLSLRICNEWQLIYQNVMVFSG